MVSECLFGVFFGLFSRLGVALGISIDQSTGTLRFCSLSIVSVLSLISLVCLGSGSGSRGGSTHIFPMDRDLVSIDDFDTSCFGVDMHFNFIVTLDVDIDSGHLNFKCVKDSINLLINVKTLELGNINSFPVQIFLNFCIVLKSSLYRIRESLLLILCGKCLDYVLGYTIC